MTSLLLNIDENNNNNTKAQFGKYWCHLCQKDFSQILDETTDIQCIFCGKTFCELIPTNNPEGTSHSRIHKTGRRPRLGGGDAFLHEKGIYSGSDAGRRDDYDAGMRGLSRGARGHSCARRSLHHEHQPQLPGKNGLCRGPDVSGQPGHRRGQYDQREDHGSQRISLIKSEAHGFPGKTERGQYE